MHMQFNFSITMILIIGFPLTIHFKFATISVTSVIFRSGWSVITKCDSSYFKVRQVLQSATILLQSVTGITE